MKIIIDEREIKLYEKFLLMDKIFDFFNLAEDKIPCGNLCINLSCISVSSIK